MGLNTLGPILCSPNVVCVAALPTATGYALTSFPSLKRNRRCWGILIMTCWPVATGGSSGRGVFAAAIVQNIVQIRLKVVFFIV